MSRCRTILVLLAAAAMAHAAKAAEVFDAKVVAVHDGDTITVLRNGHDQVRIRVEGIDCPELGQAYGRRAKQYTSGLVFGRVVTVRGKERDRYGRLVARVVVDGQDISHALVRAGLAWHFKRYSSDQTLAREEDAARAARVGLWADPYPVAPWDYRHARETGSGLGGRSRGRLQRFQ